MNKIASLLVVLFLYSGLFAQTLIKQSGWEWHISEKGTVEQLVFKNNRGNDTIPFFVGKENDGPSFYVCRDGKETKGKWIPDGDRSFRSDIDQVECRITYKVWKGQPALEVQLVNKGYVPFQPEKAGLKLGIDTYMDKYPDWFNKYFPTLMRNEKTHFYGYLQTPGKHTLALVCPQPVASWSVDYNLGYMDPPPHWFMGHRIESLNLDLMNALPLPERHPLNLWQLMPGESKSWTIALVDVGELDKLETVISKVVDFPLIRMEQTSYRPKEEVLFEVIGQEPVVHVRNDKGGKVMSVLEKTGASRFLVKTMLPETGLYTVDVVCGDKQAEAILTAHHSWKWTMENARLAALKYHQKATSHAESWYGFYSAFIANKYFPVADVDGDVTKRFDYLFDLLHDTTKMEPLYYASRIQNTSTTIGMLIDKYEAQNNVEDLRKACMLADWMIKHWQREDGAYVNHNTIYTSVIYVAKSILELALAERRMDGEEWQAVAERHYLSAKRAIDQLVESQGDFQTEGELTFEDGMISCSALQIGMLALMQKEEAARKHYTDAMLDILNSHDCLTQLKVPDGRRRQGTMRYWEAQYDVQMLPNMFNSPHGWSGWRAYATYYAYLLTGDEQWLLQTFNAMGAFANLIDSDTGDLRWAFVVDPHLRVEQACSADTHYTADSLSFGNPHPRLYDTRQFVIGEQYVNMVSNWQTVNTQDNDVHELFKCIGESVLANAFIIERADGEIIGYNCKVFCNGNTLKVEADEKQITNLHCNLKKAYTVQFGRNKKEVSGSYMGWIFGRSEYDF